jgi:hypothetical protein
VTIYTRMFHSYFSYRSARSHHESKKCAAVKRRVSKKELFGKNRSQYDRESDEYACSYSGCRVASLHGELDRAWIQTYDHKLLSMTSASTVSPSTSTVSPSTSRALRTRHKTMLAAQAPAESKRGAEISLAPLFLFLALDATHLRFSLHSPCGNIASC